MKYEQKKPGRMNAADNQMLISKLKFVSKHLVDLDLLRKYCA